jgi:hypothetical protein
MSSTSIELFRQHNEKQRQAAQERKPSQDTDKPSLVAEMSRIEHEVQQMFDDASPAERDNIIRYLGMVIRNLKRQVGNE